MVSQKAAPCYIVSTYSGEGGVNKWARFKILEAQTRKIVQQRTTAGEPSSNSSQISGKWVTSLDKLNFSCRIINSKSCVLSCYSSSSQISKYPVLHLLVTYNLVTTLTS
ncbi:unnamed protein product [Kuraishia capsulata CBS 1993]|uniref:Uncharacterized protein n=1 Tax=Kuraishia capsulata CBS 1993 TaxID=1382522 RepID=W6MPW5_9ASCO|nr:uncharacterized protein KUCA_T00004680001 [Kuraishia capsulata CBS 1993]CDK28696.1 unnamed protein product [Kuraishia capsulata CBS 1993]